jgi:copper chaperone
MCSTKLTYSVGGIHCDHCGQSITKEVEQVPGVHVVDVDVVGTSVVVQGDGIDESAVRAAIVEAGYEPELVAAPASGDDVE